MMRYTKEPPRFYHDFIKQLYPEICTNDKTPKQITFQVTENCCMACTYCYQNNKTQHKMSFDTAKSFIDKLLNDEYELVNTDNTCAIYFDFIGGEPFMEIDLIDSITEYTIKQLIILNHPWQYYIRFNICSNGLLYTTPKVQEYFKKYGHFICLNITVDGDKELHDSCRIDLNGDGTYDRVLQAIQCHTQQFHKLPSTKMTLSPMNVHKTFNAVRNLIELGYEYIYLNCVFEKGWELSHAQILYTEMIKLSDYIIDNNLYDKVYISLFEEQSFCPMDENDNENWCGGTTANMIAIDYKGNFYNCIRYMDSSLNGRRKPLNIGNIKNGHFNTQEEKENYQLFDNITRRSQSTDECFYCPIAKGCAWCSGYNYEETGTPNKRVTYICIMHKARALANVYYWNKLYKKLNINKTFVNYLPFEDIQKIKNKGEFNNG